MTRTIKPKKILLLIVVTILCLLAAISFNTLTTPSRQLQITARPATTVDVSKAAERLASAIRHQSIASASDAQLNRDHFLALHAQLAADYPLVHATLTQQRINDTALLYTWQGSEPNLPAVVLMAHMDVVPIAPGTEADWLQPPFAGVISNGFVWGRGAWDDKGNLIAQLEAVEALLARGFKPARTVYLAYGADEEVNGERGAKTIAAMLQASGVKAEFVIDEGMLITEGMIAGLDAPAAIVGVAEKGYLSATLTVSTEPGHSSMPPTNNAGAVTRLSEVLLRLRDHEMPATISGVAREMFETLGPEMHGLNRVALTNLWLFEPLVKAQLTHAPSTNAMLRTTTAFTMLSAGNKDNVLPGRAEATINFRMLPGDGSDAVLAHIQQQAAAVMPTDQFHISRLPFGGEASPVSSTEAPGYRAIQQALRELEPDTLVAPGLMLGASDSRHYSAISAQIYRFSPIHATAEDLPRFHGTNERLALTDLATMIRFYQRLIELGAGAP